MHALILTTLFALLPATSSVDHDRVEKYARDLTVETGCVVITGEALMLTACDDKVSSIAIKCCECLSVCQDDNEENE